MGVLPAAAHLIQTALLTGEREGEAQRQGGPLHPHVLKEVGHAIDDVIKQLRWQREDKKTETEGKENKVRMKEEVEDA